MSKALGRWRIAPHSGHVRPQSTIAGWRFRLTPKPCGRECGRERTYSTVRRPPRPTETRSYPVAQGGSVSTLVEHLNGLFPPLQFPPPLAERILTHASHPDALVSHNARLSFIGRRVLKSYLLLFIHSSPALQPSHDYELIVEKALNTYVLGEFVAPKWELGRVMKWTPVQIAAIEGEDFDITRLKPATSRSVGLYKVQGVTVEAVMGGIFHQFGGSIAHKVFHTRLLPHILLPDKPQGLPEAFHQHAMQMCDQLGGLTGDFSAPTQATDRQAGTEIPAESSIP